MTGARWSLQLGSLFGIPVRLHVTFFLVLVWVLSWATSRGEDVGVWLLGFLLAVVSLLCHELGHVFAARVLGVRTREIVLHPIGTQSRLEVPPTELVELIIAVAGPAVSFVLFLLAFGTTEAAGARAAGSDVGALLLPIPDVWLRLGVLLVASFVLLGCQQELLAHRQWSRLRGRTAREAMMTRYEVLRPQDSLELAARLLLAGTQREFPVVDGWGRVAGVLDRPTLYGGLLGYGRGGAVLEVMRRDVASVAPETPLEQVALRLQGGASLVVVQDDQKTLGIVTVEKLGELVDLLETLERSPGEGPTT